MKIAGSICLALGLLALLAVMSSNTGEDAGDGAEAIGETIGMYALPLLLFVAAAVMLAKASRRKKQDAEQRPES